jgi:hypothetical protein
MRILRGRAPAPVERDHADSMAVTVGNIVTVWVCVGTPTLIYATEGRLTTPALVFVALFLGAATALIAGHHYHRGEHRP